MNITHKFDSHFTTNNLQKLKVLLSYMDIPVTSPLCVFIKLRELQIALQQESIRGTNLSGKSYTSPPISPLYPFSNTYSEEGSKYTSPFNESNKGSGKNDSENISENASKNTSENTAENKTDIEKQIEKLRLSKQILDDLYPYCTITEKDTIRSFESILSQLDSYKDMMEQYQTLQSFMNMGTAFDFGESENKSNEEEAMEE